MLPTTQTRRPDGWEVAHIESVCGWVLRAHYEGDSEGFYAIGYTACRGALEIYLGVSRFNFNPTQERFAFLVRSDFPAAPGVGPWTDVEIDAAIAAKLLRPAGGCLHKFFADVLPYYAVGAGIAVVLVLSAQAFERAAS